MIFSRFQVSIIFECTLYILVLLGYKPGENSVHTRQVNATEVRDTINEFYDYL